jgi:hypothetical protein
METEEPMDTPKIVLELSRAEAVVLADFLLRFRDEERLAVDHEAEEQLLYDLCAVVEQQLPELFDASWSKIVERAHCIVLDDTDL